MKAPLAGRGLHTGVILGLLILFLCGAVFISILSLGAQTRFYNPAISMVFTIDVVVAIGASVFLAVCALSGSSTVLVPEGTQGLVCVNGKRQSGILSPGKHDVPRNTLVYLVALSTVRRTVKVQTYAQDGAKIAATCAFTVTPLDAGYWRVAEVGEGLGVEIDQAVQSVLAKRIKQFPDWQAALHGDEEIERAFKTQCVPPSRYLLSAVPNTTELPPEVRGTEVFSYFSVTNFNVINIEPDGELAQKSLMSLSKARADFRRELARMEQTVQTLHELRKLRDELMSRHPEMEDEIEDAYEVAKLRFKK